MTNQRFRAAGSFPIVALRFPIIWGLASLSKTLRLYLLMLRSPQAARLLFVASCGALLIAPTLHFRTLRQYFPVALAFELVSMMFLPSLVLGIALAWALLGLMIRWFGAGMRAIGLSMVLFGWAVWLATVSHWWFFHLSFVVDIGFDRLPAPPVFNGLAATLLVGGALGVIRATREGLGEHQVFLEKSK